MQFATTKQATRTQLTVFSGIVLPMIGIAVGLISSRWLNWTTSVTIFLGFTVLGIMGLASPQFVNPIYVAWRAVGEFLGKIITLTLLTLCFAGVILPVGLLLRWLARTPIHSADKTTAMKSYWENRNSQPEKAQYFRQY